MAKWKVDAECDDCGRDWTTKAKDNPGAPTRCSGENGCGSYKTRGTGAEKVEE